MGDADDDDNDPLDSDAEDAPRLWELHAGLKPLPLPEDKETSDDEGVSPSGHGVASIPIRVLYSHASLVGTAKDLLSQTTKSKYHVIC